MAELQFPTSNELRLIEQDKMPRLLADRIWSSFFPIENSDSSQVSWEQEDNYLGLQQVRGLGGDPPKVAKVGLKRYTMFPGVYGEQEPIDEIELTLRRQYGSFGQPVSVDDLVMRIQDKLLGRRLDRIEWIIWTLLTTGVFAVAGPSGAILHTDAYTTQTFTAGVAWATVATATPIANFRAVQLLARGHSVDFGPSATAYMNRVTFNSLMTNANAADLGGQRGPGGGTIIAPDEVNRILIAQGLPQFAIYDEGYLADTTGTFTPYIANAKVVLIGKRAVGAPIGSYRMTRNVNNPDMGPGPYTKVIDHGEMRVPRLIEIHDGHNGGPALTFPSAVVLMNV